MNYPIYILAEGKSSRMGSDKGLVKINGKEMVLHCIENLSGLKSSKHEIVIVTSHTEYKIFGFRIISDKIKNKGPAQGIVTALEDCQAEKCLIVSCDMPLVNDLMIGRFDDLPAGQAGLIIGSKICCYADEFLYPFPGIYSKRILPKWKKEVADGNLKMQSLIKQFDYKTLPIEHPELFLNVNTPADILLAEEKLK